MGRRQTAFPIFLRLTFSCGMLHYSYRRMSNRRIKERLWHQNNGKCHWCKRLTKLLHIAEIKGKAPDDLATIDHLISRYNPERWVKRDLTKVLACYECNAKRASEETKSLPKQELIRRGHGFSLNPRGKPIFTEALESIDDVLDKMKKHGIIPHDRPGTNATCEIGCNSSFANQR